ncbi:MAG: hypothetical protein IJV34_03895 [Prevotella sp.]|nr:hypothetical protein [Prevotella sp.]
MKKVYITPAIWQAEIEIHVPLLDASVTSVDMDLEEFNELIKVGGETDGADSRRNCWDD